MKIDKEAVIETALGFLIAGLVLMVLGAFVGGWLTKKAGAITKLNPDGTPSNFENSDFEKES